MSGQSHRFIGIILRLHYVSGGHGSHVSDNRDQNGINVSQRRGAGQANVARRYNRGTAVTAEMRNVMGRDKTG